MYEFQSGFRQSFSINIVLYIIQIILNSKVIRVYLQAWYC